MTEPVREIGFFHPPQRPTGGGTVYRRQVAPVTYFTPVRPNGGGTVYVKPSDSGNPYARIDEDPEAARPVVVVELPEYEEGQK